MTKDRTHLLRRAWRSVKRGGQVVDASMDISTGTMIALAGAALAIGNFVVEMDAIDHEVIAGIGLGVAALGVAWARSGFKRLRRFFLPG